ncbi:DNA mismatch repair protein MutL [Chlorobaculum parvum NCIB 8327]|uniref:DNA mismatch repair protein MutL n=1 Tax=Chlorobaculum parvum (strain DSM 263 / NCIMB 8327) TaxID=517417 RepID=MUTL_CHLP8|nr:DNA mismatch repair endonuclease MutL [Chlorobaculum parvum]B3QL59.1 RecName: Full=DNA mismatch repair protein MutL [Chlorobaculum parvum NCIB 8327]ACF12297.1 DNA mismatch repair protein MutL [Chlorobaculum parvum NCIB 8327]
MPSIAKLPDIVANKISAGEVVQRPASVVKELLENSIDSGASAITVVIKEAGRQLVRIIDNGCGMDSDDALLSVERFATSKISDVDDLNALRTLGFRGEALASISSVSHFELKTRRQSEPVGIQLISNGGEIEGPQPAQCEPGTSISVRNLFFNVPARRKFLKSNATEFKHIHETVKAFVLAYPEIEWRLINDDHELFYFRTPDVRERLSHFYGEGFGESLIEVTEENDYMTIGGYLGKPGMMVRQKYDQYFYINRRLIQNRMLVQAVQQAYAELLEERQSPFALLFLGLDPSLVDVNVHPAKLEVKFEDEKSIRSMVYPVVKRAVRTADFSPEATVAPSPAPVGSHGIGLPESSSRKLAYSDFSGKSSTTGDLYRNYRQGAFDLSGASVPPPSIDPVESSFGSGSGEPYPSMVQESLLTPSADQPSAADEQNPVAPDKEPKIWQLHNKYIICQIKTGLMIIDQHVAHERVLYERAIDVMNEAVPNSQQLLFPQKIDLKPWQYEVYEEISEELYRLGFTIRPFGGLSVMIEGVPPDVRDGNEATILQDMIAEYQENASKLKLEKRDNLAKSYSCRNAIMTGQKLDVEQMRMLIDRLFATRMPYVCPHGRPVIIRLSLGELDRMFGRT